MSEKLLVPDIGDFEKVEIIELLVKVGDEIKVNDPIITIESDKSSVEIPATVSGKVEFLNGEGHTIYKPVIRKKNGLVFVSQLTFDEEVEIEILNNTNNILYAELVDTNIELRKIFDFSELPFNDYTVIIKTQNRRPI